MFETGYKNASMEQSAFVAAQKKKMLDHSGNAFMAYKHQPAHHKNYRKYFLFQTNIV